MTEKENCVNTSYTGGFKITVDADGTFIAVKGKNRLEAESAKKLYELIKDFNEEHKAT